MIEKTLVLIKPDAFKRRLTGEIIARFERVGLKLEKMKLIKPTKEIVERHYPDDEEWLELVGEKTIKTYQKYNLNLIDDLGTDDALEIGKNKKMAYSICCLRSGSCNCHKRQSCCRSGEKVSRKYGSCFC